MLYEPTPQSGAAAQLHSFMHFCELETRMQFANYSSFETFAISQFRRFWSLLLDWSSIVYDGDREPVCVGDDCESAVFFPSLRLNYAENLLRHDRGALIGCHA